MNKCSPVETRKNMTVADTFARAGIDFVPIPAKSEDHKQELIKQMRVILEEMESDNE